MKSNYAKVLTAIMALLGFPACDREPADLYAPLSIDYEIKGKVVEKADQKKPISGIRIIQQRNGEEDWADTLYTDVKGEFSIKEYESLRALFIAEDIDGEANGGTFRRDSIRFDRTKDTPVSKDNPKLFEVNFYLEKETSDENEEKEPEQ